MKRIQGYFTYLMNIIKREEMRILPGNLAFFLVLSIIPIVSLVGIICSMFSISLTDITNLVSELIPKDVEKLLIPYISASAGDNNLIWYFILGFVLASNGAHSIIVASNTLYHIEGSSYLKRRIKAFLLTIILIVLFLFVLLFLAFGNIIFKFILSLSIFTKVAHLIYSIFIYLKYPVAFLLIFFLIKVLYTTAPDRKIASKYVNRGALFTTVGWIFVTAIYSYYANNLANYDVFYGGLSSIAILMMWIYIISYIFVIGIAINTSVYQYLEEENQDEIEKTVYTIK